MTVFNETTKYFELQGNTSGIAENVFLSKYALTDEDGNHIEKTPTEMFRRHARELARIEQKKGYKNIKPFSEDELFEFFTERFDNYDGEDRDYGGIILQGRPAFGIGNDTQFVSLLNCFILDSPEDSISGIMLREQEIAQISKRGGGCGLVMDNIRPIGSPTKNSSRTTTGLIPFMEQYSMTVERIGQNGRRGALLMGLRTSHPEIKNFITCKNKKDAITHANLPVFVYDKDMQDIIDGNPIKLHFNGESYGEVDSKELWDMITQSMWNSGDPGLMFWSEHQRNSISDCYGDEWKIVGTNPCQPYDSVIALADGRNGEKIGKLFEEGKEILVYTLNEFNKQIQVKRAKVIERGVKSIIELTLSDGNVIKCTPEHRLAINVNGVIDYIEAKNSIGYTLISLISDKLSGENIKVVSIENGKQEMTYDLQVTDNNNYFNMVNEKGYLMHNCGEIHGAPYQSCLLLSLNLYRFVNNPFTDKASFNFDKFKRYISAAIRIGDNIVDLEEEKINAILKKIDNDPETKEVKAIEYNLWKKILYKLLQSRKIGLGFTALADCLASLNLKYDSDDGIEMILKIGKTLRDYSYISSVELAKDIGAFPLFDFDKEDKGGCDFLERLYTDIPDLKEQTKRYGRRNMTLNTCAPTGTISLCAGVSAGIEPIFSLVENRMKKVSYYDETKKDLYHTDSEGTVWEKFQIKHPKYKKWEELNPDKTEHPYIEAYDVDYKKRVELQGKLNKYIDNSISSTVNLPENITTDEISELLITAWRSGCKGITVFRENSRLAVKSRVDNETVETWANGVYKRPQTIPAECFHITYNKEPYVLTVGLVKGNPYETWIWKVEDKLMFPYGAKNFQITKEKRGRYILTWDKRGPEDPARLCINDFQVDNSLIFAFTRLMSAFLRHCPDELEVLISIFEKMSQINSIPKLIARLLKKYIKDGTKVYGSSCPNCEHPLTRKSGCIFCENCGYSVCS